MRFKDIDGVRTGNLFNVALHLLNEEPGFNERNYDAPEVQAQIRRFADAYTKGEYVPNLVVRLNGSTIYIVEGHLRRRGALLAVSEGAVIDSLSCAQFLGDDADRIAFMVSSSQGLALNAVGRARAYLRLSRLGLTNDQIAEKVGMTSTHVMQYLTLASANRDVQGAVERNEIAFSLAIDIVRDHGDDAGKVIATALTDAKAAAEQKAATAKPVKHRATTKVKAAKAVKVTRKVIAVSPAKTMLAAALALCEKHASLLAGNRDDVLKTTVMVSGADLLALFDTLPAKAKATKVASA